MHRYRIGYTRTTGAQDHSEEVLSASGCHEIVSETAGPRQNRPQLRATLDRMTVGDILVVTRPSQLAPDATALLALLAGELAPRGIALQILSGVSAGLHEPRGTPAEQGLFATAALVTELEHDLRSERTHEGLAAARAHGRPGGRPRALSDDQLAAARARRARGQSIPDIALELGVGRSTLYRALEDDSPPTTAAAAPLIDPDHARSSPGPGGMAVSDPTPDATTPSSTREQAVEPTSAPADHRQAVTEASGQGLAEPDAPAVLPAPRHAQPVDQRAAAPAPELYLAKLSGENCLLLVDGERVGWLHAAPVGWQIHDRDGRLVTTLPTGDAPGRDVLIGLNAARLAAAALGIPGAEHAAVAAGPLTDARGRTLDTSPASLASWSLLKGRVPGRTDVIVRSRCVGWLQRDDRSRDVACTIDGPVPGSASTNRVQAVTALLAALLAPAPLPDLGPEARTPRRPRARPARERPISPFTPAQLAAAALADNLPRLPDGSYRVHIDDGYDDTELGRVYRSGRRWQALAPDGRVVVHRAATRTEAVDQLLATPGPLFGDPADTVLHDLDNGSQS
ncbi:recombinase family protein [Nonomuraea sp. 10N515B]|uniref:recombinase family protein n=1 Tax=Nonomuraea sp. 10N515B TaxID=3457422 RepID=UPI003FCD7941